MWLNNPTRPYEASGTSGMKPPLHGGLNCSVLDGWWPEAFDGKNGWEIGGGRELGSQAAQDRHDAECIYRLLEEKIVPTFYRRDRLGRPAPVAQAGDPLDADRVRSLQHAPHGRRLSGALLSARPRGQRSLIVCPD